MLLPFKISFIQQTFSSIYSDPALWDTEINNALSQPLRTQYFRGARHGKKEFWKKICNTRCMCQLLSEAERRTSFVLHRRAWKDFPEEVTVGQGLKSR